MRNELDEKISQFFYDFSAFNKQEIESEIQEIRETSLKCYGILHIVNDLPTNVFVQIELKDLRIEENFEESLEKSGIEESEEAEINLDIFEEDQPKVILQELNDDEIVKHLLRLVLRNQKLILFLIIQVKIILNQIKSIWIKQHF